MSEVHFRPATSADAGAIADVYLTSRREFVGFAPLAHTDDEVRGWIADVVVPTGGVTVAEDDGQIVGFLATDRDSDDVGWIEHLYLAPSHVGQGIGSKFVVQAKAELGAPIHLYTFQPNAGARRFYERHGFVAVAFGDGTGNEEGVPDVLYAWREGEISGKASAMDVTLSHLAQQA